MEWFAVAAFLALDVSWRLSTWRRERREHREYMAALRDKYEPRRSR